MIRSIGYIRRLLACMQALRPPRRKALVALAFVSLAVPTPPSKACQITKGATFVNTSDRQVFSVNLPYEYTYDHYNPPLGDAASIAALKHDIQDAIAVGITGFELSIIGRQDQYPTVYNMFEAAKELHDANPSQPPFWLYFAPDIGGGGAANTYPWTVPPNRDWMEYFVATFAHHPNYFHYNGKAVMGSFLGLDQQAELTNSVFTPLHNEGIDVFYVPSAYNGSQTTTDGTTFTPRAQANIGSLHCWTGSVPASDIGCSNGLDAINAANGKPRTMDVSVSTFWEVHGDSSIYFDHAGGEGPDAEWQNAISKNPVFIIESPWNDLAESYSSPVDIPNVPTVLSGYPYDNLLKPHAGYAEVNKYYREWYLTGAKPTITQDFIAYFYRTSPKAANNHPSNPNPPNYVGTDALVLDDVYVTVDLVTPATLQINTGGTITTYNLGAGRNLVHTPFTPGATQNFQIIRGGQQVVSVSGQPILATVTQNDMQWTSGFSYSPSCDTPTPTPSGAYCTAGLITNPLMGTKCDPLAAAVTRECKAPGGPTMLCPGAQAQFAACEIAEGATTTTGVWTAANFANSGVRGFNQPGDTSAASMAEAKAYGSKVNVMRFFIDQYAGVLSNNGSQYRIGNGAYGTFDFTAVDAALANMQSAGIKMIPVIDDGKVLFNNSSLQDSFVAMWQAFATHYRGNAGIAAFDLWNEPISGGATRDQWIALSQRAASAIRAIDPDHVIIWESLPWDSAEGYDGMTTMPLAAFNNIVYEYHDYDPFQFCLGGVDLVNASYGLKYPVNGLACFKGGTPLNWNASTIGANGLNCDGSGRQTILDLQAKFNFPILVGEFSAFTAAPINDAGVPSATQWVDDNITYFHSKGMSWIYHDWRNWWGWEPDVLQSDAKSLVDTGAPYPLPLHEDSPTSQVLKKHFAE